jgi:hypothetical protein
MGKLSKADLVLLLAQEAKHLTHEMQKRVNRNPDVADYLACFIKAVIKTDAAAMQVETRAEDDTQ